MTTEIIHKGLTLAEINTKFGNDYDMTRANRYLIGYRNSDKKYDVKEGKGSIIIIHHDAPWSLPITAADLIDKTPCDHCGGDGVDPDQSAVTDEMMINGNFPIACNVCWGSCIKHNPLSDD